MQASGGTVCAPVSGKYGVWLKFAGCQAFVLWQSWQVCAKLLAVCEGLFAPL